MFILTLPPSYLIAKNIHIPSSLNKNLQHFVVYVFIHDPIKLCYLGQMNTFSNKIEILKAKNSYLMLLKLDLGVSDLICLERKINYSFIICGI